MGDPWDDDNGPQFPDDPTHVDAIDSIVEEIDQGATTKPHDGKEFLQGFEAGKKGRVMDVLQALIAVQLSDYSSEPEAKAYARRVLRQLEAMENEDALRKGEPREILGE